MVSGAVGAGDAAHGERAEAAWIAGGEDAVARHHDDGEGAFDLARASRRWRRRACWPASAR